MSKHQKVSLAEQTRINYRLLRLNAPRVDLSPPRLHADNPLLPDTGDDEGNKLHSEHQGYPLKVEVHKFDTSSEVAPVQVQLLWDHFPTGSRTPPINAPIPDDEFPFILELPADRTTLPGNHLLGYRVLIGGNTEPTPVASMVDVFIDRTPPNNNVAGRQVTLPAEVEANGITKEYLDRVGFVTITVQEYADANINDVVDVYFGDRLPAAILVGTITRADLSVPMTVQLTAAQIGSNEGAQSIYYILKDRVGNTGPNSAFKPVEVILREAPQNMQPPTVPLAPAPDFMIDLADAYEGVAVQLESYDVLETDDKFEVTWDGALIPPSDIPGFPAFSSDMSLRVLRGSPVDLGPKTVHVSYSIVRGTRRYPEAVGVQIEVDLRKPGPEKPDPEDPDPVNPNLRLVDVLGGSGNNPINVLTIDDANQPATATVPIYDERKLGDSIQLYWNGTPIPATAGGVYTVTGAEAKDFPVSFTIPWSIIDTTGNDIELPVHYVVSHDLNDNVDTSRPRLVSVFIKDASVPRALFQNLDPDLTDWLNCQSLRDEPGLGWVAKVFVGPEPELVGKALSFTYQGWMDSTGTTEKPGTKHEFSYTPDVNDATNGFVVNLIYEPLRLTEDVWGSIEYTVMMGGFPVPSTRHLVRVYMALTGGGTCKAVGP
ncbi:hypothetical protein UG46_16520 [Pseudomonas fluorescens]|uniref:hypothetical protein n=1 Tax=Pseudomonas fluorescens TaxID=294 RepID=UPI0005DE5B41|nr:hypothetical protein [Pseudomonas fluorescens]KJH85327.1 hypothetical protein UG46_16520 [Pseudomonas fluorescens]